jgi:hypothetical protein
VKTFNGLASASWKTWNGLSTVSAPAYSFIENFETPTTGYDNTGWTTTNAGNPAYSTSPAPLTGTQSFFSNTGAIRGFQRNNSLTGEIWYYWQMYCITGVVNDYHWYGDAAETSCRVGFTSGKIQLRVGTTITAASGTFPLDQKVHVWVRFAPGASGTANGDLYYSTTGTRGSSQCAVTGASTTTETTRPWWLSRSTYGVIWDRIIINSSAIGDNP